MPETKAEVVYQDLPPRSGTGLMRMAEVTRITVKTVRMRMMSARIRPSAEQTAGSMNESRPLILP